MKRRDFLRSAAAISLAPLQARAQADRRPARVGWVTAQQAGSLTTYLDALRRSLAELGYVEGRNLTLILRFGNDDLSRVPALVDELQRIPVDLILAQGAAVPLISTQKLEVPLVYVFSGDPVAAGLAESLSKPRAGMTGLTFMAAELNGKRIEMLREIMPELRRVSIVANPEHPGADVERDYSEATAKRLGLAIRYFPTPTGEALNRAFATMAADPPGAISLFADGFAIEHRQRIIDFAMGQKAPVVSGWPIFAKSGALCTYGPRLIDSYRRLAYYVDRVLKGAKPADLPIERPTTFELVLNQATAKTLGLTLPQSLLLRADEVIG